MDVIQNGFLGYLALIAQPVLLLRLLQSNWPVPRHCPLPRERGVLVSRPAVEFVWARDRVRFGARYVHCRTSRRSGGPHTPTSRPATPRGVAGRLVAYDPQESQAGDSHPNSLRADDRS